MKFFTNEIKIAIVAILGIVVLFFGLNFLKGASVFSNDNTYFIKFDNVEGLSASNTIFADGYQVGVVKDMAYDYSGNGGILVKIDVDTNLRIPKGSSAEIVSDMMGNVKMNLLLPKHTNDYIAVGDTIVGSQSAGLMAMVGGLMPTVQQMLPKVDSILSNVNALLADPALAQSLHNAKEISDNLNATSKNLNTLMADLNTRMPGMMNKADLALDKVGTTLDNTSKLTANLAQIDVQGTMAQVNQTLSNVQELTAKLNSKDGTLGLLMNDDRLYFDLHNTVHSADSLLTDLKAHPKRYVHFSLFGKKDR